MHKAYADAKFSQAKKNGPCHCGILGEPPAGMGWLTEVWFILCDPSINRSFVGSINQGNFFWLFVCDPGVSDKPLDHLPFSRGG